MLLLLFGIWNARKLFQKETTNGQSSAVSSKQSSPNSSSASSGSLSASAKAEEEKLIPVALSYLTQDGVVYIAFQGIFYRYKEFPYKIQNGPFKTLVASIPESVLETTDTKNEPKKDKTAIF